MRALFLVLGGLIAAIGAAPAAASADLLYSQVGSGTYSQISYDFVNPSLDQDDSQGADDFTVPDGETWHIDSIDVFGSSLQGSPGTDTANVFIYDSAGALPGPAVFSQGGIQTGATATTNPNMNQQEIDFTAPLTAAPQLGPGTHWISVQARGPYSWGWEVLNGAPQANSAVWQNPGGGLGQGCRTYTPIHSCGVPATVGQDYFFRLNGTLIDSRFSLGRFKVKSQRKLTLAATFPGPGTAVVADASTVPATGRATASGSKKNVKRAAVTVPGAGAVKLPVRLTRAAIKKLKEHRKVKVRVAVTFTATGGAPFTQQANVKLIPRRSARGLARVG